jgi:hypothetical protein
MKKYIIEVEETKAETVVNLLVAASVRVDKPTEEKKRYVKIYGEYGVSDAYLCLTEEQFNLLRWLSDGYFCDWAEVDPTEMFEEV